MSAPDEAWGSRVADFVARHNRTVLAAGALTLSVSLCLWAAMLFALSWGELLRRTIARGLAGRTIDSGTDYADWREASFRVLGGIAFVLLLLAVVLHGQRLRAWRENLPTWVRGILDLALFPADSLFDALDSFRALVRLRRRHRALAGAIVRRLQAGGGNLPLTELAQETSDLAALECVVSTLHVAQAVETRAGKEGPILRWYSEEARDALSEKRERGDTQKRLAQ